MKIQCSCGTKVAFDVTPGMATNPVQFICPNCGLDSSAMVNQLIRQELGVSGAAPAPVPRPAAAPPPVPPPMPGKPAMRVALASSAPASATPALDASPGKEFCLKHPGKLVAHKCLVCGKAMCPDCMALFGYVCSPLCRSKAEARKLDIPVYAQQKSAVEARRWRKTGLVAGSVGGVVALLAGFWFWYAWFGSVPNVAFAMSFPNKVSAGEVRLAGTDQLVFLHGADLGRIDLKSKRQLWSLPLVDRKTFVPEAEQTIKQLEKARERYYATAEDPEDFKIPPLDKIVDELVESAIEGLKLVVAGQNVWVLSGDSLTRYEWDTGKPAQTIKLAGAGLGMRREGNELLLTEPSEDLTSETTLHINLVTGESSKTTIEKPLPPKLVELLTAATNRSTRAGTKVSRASSARVSATTAKVVAANAAARPSTPLDPQRIAAQTENMSFAAKVALPALLANARHQQELAAEMAGTSGAKPTPPTELDQAIAEWDDTQMIPTPEGPVQFTRTLLERKMVTREAMKAPPKKSALNGNVSAADSMAVANEMLNEMQRDRGSTVTEDQSRYRVTLKRAGKDVPVWTGEVAGPPAFYPLQTVDILTAGATAIALDHANKKLWQAPLNFPVHGNWEEWDAAEEPGAQSSGLGPCVERSDTIYIFDQGSLAAFDRTTGAARWRLPSVGISGLWFDDRGMLYVNTTTASPDSIRYSRQIDISNQALSEILKVDPKTGKTLWSCTGAKHICYLWKQYLFTTDSNPGPDPEGDGLGMTTGLETPAFLRIRRIDAGSGRILWEHVQKRCPLDIQFHENTIQLLFKNEVQELKFVVL